MPILLATAVAAGIVLAEHLRPSASRADGDDDGARDPTDDAEPRDARRGRYDRRDASRDAWRLRCGQRHGRHAAANQHDARTLTQSMRAR